MVQYTIKQAGACKGHGGLVATTRPNTGVASESRTSIMCWKERSKRALARKTKEQIAILCSEEWSKKTSISALPK